MKIVIGAVVILLLSIADGMSQSYVPQVYPTEILVEGVGSNHSLECIVPDFVSPENVMWFKVPAEFLEEIDSNNTICSEDVGSGNGQDEEPTSDDGKGASGRGTSGSGSGSATSGSGNTSDVDSSDSGMNLTAVENGDKMNGNGTGSGEMQSGNEVSSGTVPGNLIGGSGGDMGSGNYGTIDSGDEVNPTASENGNGMSASENETGSEGMQSGSGIGESGNRTNSSETGSGSENGSGMGSGNKMSSGMGFGSGIGGGSDGTGSGNGVSSGVGFGSGISGGDGGGNRVGSGNDGTSESGVSSGSGQAGGDPLDDLPVIARGLTLNFTSVMYGEEGHYICRVQQRAQSCVSNQTATLFIAPRISMVSTVQAVNRGDTVTLFCEVQGGPGNNIKWVRDGQDFENETISNDSLSTLTLLNVSIADGGTYTCSVTNRAGTTSAIARVNILPYITMQLQNVTGRNNTMAKLQCPIDGLPRPSFQWRRLVGNTTTVTSMTNQLIFNPLRFDDQGLYFCRGSSDNSFVDSDIATVTVSPEGSVRIVSLDLDTGVRSEMFGYTYNTSVVLVCENQGGPNNEFTWTLPESTNDDNVVIDVNMLEIHGVTANNGGDYSCMVANAAGNESDTITVTVSPEGSVRIVSLDDLDTGARSEMFNYTYNTTVMLLCENQGGPNNEFTWTLPESTNFDNIVIDVDILEIRGLKAINGGDHTCMVANAAGNESNTITVTVSPRITRSPVDTTVVTGEDLLLTCEADGYPIPDIIWFHNMTEITDGLNDYNIPSLTRNISMLTVSRVEISDTGTYTCQAVNGVGEPDTVHAMVTVQLAGPEQPQNVTVVGVGSREVNLTWVEPHDNNNPITEYQVMYMQPEFALGEREGVVNTTMENATITGLFPGVNYTFTVIAYNEIGRSLPSDPVPVKTEEEAPTGPPSNVMAMAVSSTAIMVTWDMVPTIDQNGIITMYEVLYEPMETFGDVIGAMMTNVSGSAMVVVLTDLQEFVNYDISVRAYTNQGAGPYSTAVREMTEEDAPASPPDNVMITVISFTEIMVMWDVVPLIDQNGNITMYEVRYEQLETFGGEIETSSINVTAQMTSVMLTDLQEFVDYNISVRAYTSVGEGPYSVGVTAMTLQDNRASPPDNVNATAISSTSIVVNWDIVPDMDQNGNITMYEVRYEPLETFGGQIQTNSTNIMAPTMTVTLTDLQEFVEYNISVRAYTSEGEGPYSVGVTAMTLQDNPASPPDNITAVVNSSTSIVVSWDMVPAIDQNGDITMYEVRYEPLETFGGEIETSSTNITAVTTSLVLTDLQEFVNYNISVRAYTSVGEGPYSVDVTTMTLQDNPASPPDNVTAMANSSTSIVVTWYMAPAIDQNGDITMYEVRYEPLETFGGEIETSSTNVTAQMTSVMLTDLQEFVDYNISVRAYTSMGEGPYSVGVTAMTLQDNPTNPPDNVTAMVNSSTSIVVNWDMVPAIDQNGNITVYEVRYELLETFGGQIQTNSTNIMAPTMTATLTDLQEFVTYNISVRAYTSVGEGPYSVGMTAITLQDNPASPPDNVTAVVNSSTSIVVSWDMVPAIEQNGIITMYEVRYEPLETFDGQIQTNSTNISAVMTSLVLTDLQEFVNYNISVRAYTSVGEGPYSVGVTTMTPQDNPASPPENVTAMVNSSTSIVVTWGMVPTIDQNGDITMYEVRYEPLETFDGEIQTNSTNFTAAVMSVTLTDLQEFVNYNISVRAYTNVGAGPYSTEISEQTFEDAPSASPLNVNATELNSSSAVVQWDPLPSIDQNGILTLYEVSLQPIQVNGVPVQMGEVPMLVNISISELMVIVDSLEGFVTYSVTVRAYTMVGAGPYSSPPIQITTDEDKPGPISKPPPVSDMDITPFSAVVSWMRPDPANGIIRNYTVNLVALADLSPPATGQGESERGKRRRRRQIIRECITRLGGKVDNDITVNGTQTNTTLTRLAPFTRYEFKVLASTDAGSSQFSPSTEFNTTSGPPSNVTSLSAAAINSTSIRVTWAPPPCPYGIIANYIVFYRQSNEPLLASILAPMASTEGYERIEGIAETEVNITNLSPYTNYTIHVQAVSDMGLRGERINEILQRTNSSVPISLPTPPPSDTVITTETTTVLIGDPRLIDTGRVIFCAVVVVEGTARANRSFYDNAQPFTEPGPSFYITAAWGEEDIYSDGVPGRLVVGDNTFYPVRVDGSEIQYKNVPLRSGTLYSIFVRYDIENDANPNIPLRAYSPATISTTVVAPASPPADVIVAVVVIFLIVILAIVVFALIFILFFKYRRREKLRGDRDSPTNNVQLLQAMSLKDSSIENNNYTGEVEEETSFDVDPVPVDDFKNYVRQHHIDDNALFSKEYKEVEPKHRPTSKATQNPNNTTKNRYANITAYDHSRVKLQPIEGEPNSDYINANFLDGYKVSNKFIAAQGPVPASVGDFWRMIWEQKVGYVVMVTNLEEKGRIKCHRYWPDDTTKKMTQGSFEIETQEVLVLAEYTIRTFSLQKANCKDERIVRQFHFTVWPDHGVPEYPAQLLHFVHKVMQEDPIKTAPMVVHCSAGVGRTGTFITLFTQLQRMKAEGNVNIFGFVRSMRKRRCYMVQTEDQYIFSHDAILEAIECGVTEVAARDLSKQLKKLSMDGRLEAEFKKLSTTIHKRIEQTAFAMSANKPKNRHTHPKKTPYDKTRVILKTDTDNPSDYINASHIDGYHKLKAYIATQDPLPDTTSDFWRMVWQNKCTTIVKLSREKEDAHQYWPDKGVINHSTLQIIFHTEDNFADYTLRCFKIVDTTDESSLEVKQYQYLGWPADVNGVPENGSGLIDLIGQVQKWQMSSDNKPIVVHCNDGCGCTGVFIAVSILVERLKTEGVVDVFHTVRTLRLQRPEMVANLAQYEFCYKAVLEFLDSFELYSNFK